MIIIPKPRFMNIQGSFRIVRGGGWFFYGKNCRSAVCYRVEPILHDYDMGFRVILKKRVK